MLPFKERFVTLFWAVLTLGPSVVVKAGCVKISALFLMRCDQRISTPTQKIRLNCLILIHNVMLCTVILIYATIIRFDAIYRARALSADCIQKMIKISVRFHNEFRLPWINVFPVKRLSKKQWASLLPWLIFVFCLLSFRCQMSCFHTPVLSMFQCIHKWAP